jgi:hypothetical protein
MNENVSGKDNTYEGFKPKHSSEIEDELKIQSID